MKSGRQKRAEIHKYKKALESFVLNRRKDADRRYKAKYRKDEKEDVK